MSDANRSLTDLAFEVTLITQGETCRTNSLLPFFLDNPPLTLHLPDALDGVVRHLRHNLRPLLEDGFFACSPATASLCSAITLIFPEKLIIDGTG